MSKHHVKVTATFSIKEATRLMQEKQQTCVLVVDNEDFLEGIVTLGDIRRKGYEPSENSTGEDSSTLDVCKLLILCLQSESYLLYLFWLALHTFTSQLCREILLLSRHASLEVFSSMAMKED